MRVSPTTKGYTPRVYQPKAQRYSAANRSPDDLIVTPRYDEWLVRNPEITADRSILKRVLEHLLVPPRDRRRSFSASQAGYCLRRQELAFLGVRKNRMSDSVGIRIFQNGTFVHLRWQIGVLAAGIIDGIEVTVKSLGGMSRATLDGIGVARGGRYDGAPFGWEHKGRMSFAFKAQESANTPDEKTRKQVARQMLLTGYDVWSVTNENKDNQQHGEFVIERDSNEIDDSRKEVRELVRAVERRKLHPMLPECIKRNSTGEYYKCPFGTDLGSCVSSGSWPSRV
jgi:hypothetical protein